MVEHPASLDRTYGALAHPVRREIVSSLARREQRVTELAGGFPISLAAVSKHVQQLERAGLVQRRVVGRDHWLALRPQPLADASAWLDYYRAFWSARLDALDGVLQRGREVDP